MPVHNDFAGGMVELDSMYMGQDAIVHGSFSRYNHATYFEMAKYAQTVPTLPETGILGTDSAGERGTLMVQENAGYPLWVKFPYAFKPSMNPGGSTGNIPAGYKFIRAWLIAPDDLDPGVAPLVLDLTWHALGQFIPSSQGGKFVVWNNDMSGLPNPD